MPCAVQCIVQLTYLTHSSLPSSSPSAVFFKPSSGNELLSFLRYSQLSLGVIDNA